MLCRKIPLRLNAELRLWFQFAPASILVWSADADAGEVGLTPGYFYTIAAGYNAS